MLTTKLRRVDLKIKILMFYKCSINKIISNSHVWLIQFLRCDVYRSFSIEFKVHTKS